MLELVPITETQNLMIFGSQSQRSRSECGMVISVHTGVLYIFTCMLISVQYNQLIL